MAQFFILALITLFTFLGCAGLNPEEEFNYGQEFSAEEVLSAIDLATANNSAQNAQVGTSAKDLPHQEISAPSSNELS